MFKHTFFNRLFLVVAIFYLLVVANANASDRSFFSQEVYLADRPLPEIVANLKQLGLDEQQILTHIKKTLPAITPELAKEKFGIKWIDNNLPGSDLVKLHVIGLSKIVGDGEPPEWPIVYPALVVSYISPEVGYGLFALENIKKGRVIVGCTGRRITDKKFRTYSPYVSDLDYSNRFGFEQIDAEKNGNAARFALHFPNEDTLDLYGYKSISGDDFLSKEIIATDNLGLITVVDGSKRYLVLASVKDIKLFEPIGFHYNYAYGYEDSLWPKEPLLFDKDGNIIPASQYKMTKKAIRFVDQIEERYIVAQKSEVEDLIMPLENGNFVRDYLVINAEDGIKIVCDRREYNKQISKPGNRIYVPSYFINYDTDIEKFINFLESGSEFGIAAEVGDV